MSVVVGIDPGAHGAIVVLDETGDGRRGAKRSRLSQFRSQARSNLASNPAQTAAAAPPFWPTFYPATGLKFSGHTIFRSART
jgi:hypothetical protein